MKKIALVVLVGLIAVSPAVAKKRHHHRMAAPAPAIMDSNEASYRLVRDSIPVFLPSVLIPIYLSANQVR